MQLLKKKSAAHIRIRPKAVSQPGYAQLIASAGENQHDQIYVLISALIGDGVNTRQAIISACYRYGFKAGHAVHQLDHHTGSDPVAHHWSRDLHGIYRLLA